MLQISIVTWIMTLVLVGTYMLLNFFESKTQIKADRGVELHRHSVWYDFYIPSEGRGKIVD